MTPRQLALIASVVLAGLGGADAWGLTVTTSLATSGPSSLSHTLVVTNEDATGTAPVTATFEVTNTDYLVPLGSVFGHYVAEAELLGSGSVDLAGFADTTNTAFGKEIALGSADESTVPFIGPVVPLTLSGPYALTLNAQFTLSPGDTLSFTHTVSVLAAIPAVPEPAGAVLLLAGLVLVGVTQRWTLP